MSSFDVASATPLASASYVLHLILAAHSAATPRELEDLGAKSFKQGRKKTRFRRRNKAAEKGSSGETEQKRKIYALLSLEKAFTHL